MWYNVALDEKELTSCIFIEDIHLLRLYYNETYDIVNSFHGDFSCGYIPANISGSLCTL